MINNLTDLDPFYKKDYSKKKLRLWENRISLRFDLPYSSFEALFNDEDPDAYLDRCECCGKYIPYHPWTRGSHVTLCDECYKVLNNRFESKSFPWVFEKEDDTARLLDYFYTYL